jgi:hypothetical protein
VGAVELASLQVLDADGRWSSSNSDRVASASSSTAGGRESLHDVEHALARPTRGAAVVASGR